ncbi:hypothetical protein JZ751_003070, partial [Albula glossodonta]
PSAVSPSAYTRGCVGLELRSDRALCGTVCIPLDRERQRGGVTGQPQERWIWEGGRVSALRVGGRAASPQR